MLRNKRYIGNHRTRCDFASTTIRPFSSSFQRRRRTMPGTHPVKTTG
jgi:hypothetical protein